MYLKLSELEVGSHFFFPYPRRQMARSHNQQQAPWVAGDLVFLPIRMVVTSPIRVEGDTAFFSAKADDPQLEAKGEEDWHGQVDDGFLMFHWKTPEDAIKGLNQMAKLGLSVKIEKMRSFTA